MFAYGDEWFFYCESESEEEELTPDSLFAEASEWLAAWPGGAGGGALGERAGGEREETRGVRHWAPMTDIFHYQRPVSREHWQRRNPERTPFGRMAVLKPEEIASYVYYHYQYQEERPGDGDKYGIIGLHENVLFFYSELPATVEPAPYEGKLKTKLRPDDWQAVMDPHFVLWEGAKPEERVWRRLTLVLETRGEEGRRS
ncbi:hypothetical protein E6C55_19470 [Cohnella fermenti]|uniref:Uncharacterized protein n=1 Tax=Cohnella fermenti TaxID=2565925 RepID=A0A4S4BN55_9BACL|nr:hypothetical protein E6C55_19470 [Cohnella fermenti]